MTAPHHDTDPEDDDMPTGYDRLMDAIERPAASALTDATQEWQMPPRPRPAAAEATRLDALRLTDVPDPTVVTPARGLPRVNPPGAHTGGAARIVAAAQADQDRIAEDMRRALGGEPATPGGVFRVRRRRNRRKLSVREQAAARARQKARHERTIERLETVRALLAMCCLFALLVLIVGMAVVSWGILAGWFTWAPVHTR